MKSAARRQLKPRPDRRRTLKTGLVFTGDDADPVKCSLLNWSARGARLRFDPPYEGPDHFQLQIDFGQLTLATMACEVRWRQGQILGVQFSEDLPFEATF